MTIKALKLLCPVTVALTLTACAHSPNNAEAKSETLSTHETVAEFLGTSYHRCLGMTSLCPDECGDSGTMASFRICKYMKYEKLGDYGDPRSEQFNFLIEDNMKNLKVNATTRDTVAALKKGDAVLLSWKHNYVTVNGSSGPERPIVKLKLLAAKGTPECEGYTNPARTTVVFQSASGEELHVIRNIVTASATLLLPEKPITLPQVISASGARYAADGEEFWNKGENAIYSKNGVVLFEGREIIPSEE